MRKLLNTRRFFLFVLPFLTISFPLFSQMAGDYRSVAGTSWSTLATWERYSGAVWATPTAGEGYPGQNTGTGNVDIRNGHAVTLDVSPANSIGSLTTTSTNANTTLTFSGFTLNCTGGVVYSGPTNNTFANTIAVGSGVLTCGSITMANTGGGNQDCILSISTGTVTSTGALSMPGAATENAVTFTGAGLIQIGGSMTGNGTFTASTGTAEFTSAGASNFDNYTFNNLKISGAGTKSLNGNTVVGGTLHVAAGTLACAGLNISVTSTVTIDGSFTIAGGNIVFSNNVSVAGTMDNTSASGTNTISGDVVVTGTWNNTGGDDYTIGGNFTNNGTVNSGLGNYTFTGAGKTFSGTSPITFGQDLDVNGSYTSAANYTVTVNRNLTGSGSFTQSSNSVLNLGNHASAITSLNASVNPNIVNYFGTLSGSDMACATYYHVHITKSAAGNHAGFSCATTVNGDVKIFSGELYSQRGAGTFTTTVAGSIYVYSTGTLHMAQNGSSAINTQNLYLDGGTIDGGVAGDINVASTFSVVTASTGTVINCDLSVTGNSTVSGTLVFSGASGTKTFADLTIGGTWTSTNEDFTLTGNFTNNGTFTSGTGTYDFTGAGKTISGTSVTTFSQDVTISGTIINAASYTVTVARDMLGTGTFTQSANSVLNIGDGATLSTLTATASGNIVNYNSTYTGSDIRPATYYHLHISKTGAGNAQMTGNTTVSGDLVVNSGRLDSDNGGGPYTHSVAGKILVPSGAILKMSSSALTAINTQTLVLSGGTIEGGAAGDINVASSFSVSASTTNTVESIDLVVSGTSNIDGTINFAPAGGIKTFNGNFVLASTGTWGSTANESFSFGGNITNNGTFNAGTGTYTLTGTAKTLSGINPISFGQHVNISGSYTSVANYTVTIGRDLLGTGSFTQSSNSVLNIGDNANITTLTASVNPNIVNYNSAFAGSNINCTPYHHLYISKTGGATARFMCSNTVNGNLIVDSGAQLNSDNTSVYTHTMNGATTIYGIYNIVSNTSAINFQDLTLSGGTISGGGATAPVNVATTFTATSAGNSIDACVFTVTGASTINGALTLGSNSGVKTFVSAVTVNPGGSWNSTAVITAGRLDFRNGIVNNATSFLAGAADFTTNNQALTGGTAFSFANDVSVTGITLTNNCSNAVSIINTGSGSLRGTGTWTQGASTTLNYTGNTITISVLNASASGNTIKYDNNGGQTVFASSSGQYYHLRITGTTGTKELSSDITVLGDITIEGAAVLSTGPTNPTSFDISVVGNWNNSSTNGDPFVERLKRVTFAGSGAQSVINTGDAQGTEFYNVTVNNSSPTGVTLSGTAGNHLIITAAGTLTFTDGYVYTTASNLVQVNSGAFSTGGSAGSFVDGPVRKIGNAAFVFPTGDDKAPAGFGAEDKWARIGISAPATATTEFTAQYFFAANPDVSVDATINNVSINEYWNLDRAVNADNVNVTLYFENATGSGIPDYTSADLRVARFNGADWVDNGQSSISGTDPGSVTSALASSFNTQFTFASDGGVNPLPVEFLSFEAVSNGNVVDVKWSTSVEFNSDYFLVQHSSNGVDFLDVEKIKASGNSSMIKEYTVIDHEPYRGVSYYRLKQVDLDGKFAYTDMVAVHFQPENAMAVYPNPSSGPFMITLNAKSGNEILVVIKDLHGKELYSKVVIVSNDEEIIEVDPKGRLASGVYMIVATSGANIYEKKIVIR